MSRVLLTISYDGTAYHGWQVQPNGVTVQEVLQLSLEKLLGQKVGVSGCSRTDAGVHAKEFCCHFDCPVDLPEKAFVKGLDALLPKDIAVIKCIKVADDFHARYNAKGKTYCYYIYNNNISNPYLSRYSWKIERELDLEKINSFCKSLVGTHDFYGFSSSGRSVTDTVRTINECFAERRDDCIVITVTANGFLYNMVRIIVGTAIAVSDGRLGEDCANKIFETKERSLAGDTAPPEGLFLEKVWY